MIRRPPRSTQSRSSAASDVYKRQENLTLLAEAAGQLAPPLQSTPTEDAGLSQDHRTTQRPCASDPPPGLHHQHWRSLFGSHLQGAPESTTTPLAHQVSVPASIASASKTPATSSLLLPRAAAYTPPARPTHPPGAGPPFSSLVPHAGNDPAGPMSSAFRTVQEHERIAHTTNDSQALSLIHI